MAVSTGCCPPAISPPRASSRPLSPRRGSASSLRVTTGSGVERRAGTVPPTSLIRLIQIVDPTADGDWSDRVVRPLVLPTSIPQVKDRVWDWGYGGFVPVAPVEGQDASRSVLLPLISRAGEYQVHRLTDSRGRWHPGCRGRLRACLQRSDRCREHGPDEPAIRLPLCPGRSAASRGRDSPSHRASPCSWTAPWSMSSVACSRRAAWSRSRTAPCTSAAGVRAAGRRTSPTRSFAWRAGRHRTRQASRQPCRRRRSRLRARHSFLAPHSVGTFR